MPVIFRRPRASADLSEIWEFIAGDNIQRADEFIDRIDEKERWRSSRSWVASEESQAPE
jgi:plasmid stabilization system protein ParE